MEYVVSMSSVQVTRMSSVECLQTRKQKGDEDILHGARRPYKKVQYAKEEVLLIGDLNIPMNQKTNKNTK